MRWRRRVDRQIADIWDEIEQINKAAAVLRRKGATAKALDDVAKQCAEWNVPIDGFERIWIPNDPDKTMADLFAEWDALVLSLQCSFEWATITELNQDRWLRAHSHVAWVPVKRAKKVSA